VWFWACLRLFIQEKYAICFVHRAYSYFFNVKGLCLPILTSFLSGFHVIYQIRNIVFDHISKHQEEKTKRVENTTHTRVFWRTLRCLEMLSNTVVKKIILIKISYTNIVAVMMSFVKTWCMHHYWVWKLIIPFSTSRNFCYIIINYYLSHLNKLQYFEKKPSSALAGFHVGPLSWLVELEFEHVRFCGGRKIGEPRNPQNPRGKAGFNKRNSHMPATRPERNPGNINRSQVLTPLRHPK